MRTITSQLSGSPWLTFSSIFSAFFSRFSSSQACQNRMFSSEYSPFRNSAKYFCPAEKWGGDEILICALRAYIDSSSSSRMTATIRRQSRRSAWKTWNNAIKSPINILHFDLLYIHFSKKPTDQKSSVQKISRLFVISCCFAKAINKGMGCFQYVVLSFKMKGIDNGCVIVAKTVKTSWNPSCFQEHGVKFEC